MYEAAPAPPSAEDTAMSEPESFLPLTPVVYHILLALADEPRHGYGVIKHVADLTEGRVELEAGTLYAAIKRLRDDDLLEERKTPAGADARRRYYTLTRLGRRVLRAESKRLIDMIELARAAGVVRPSPGSVR